MKCRAASGDSNSKAHNANRNLPATRNELGAASWFLCSILRFPNFPVLKLLLPIRAFRVLLFVMGTGKSPLLTEAEKSSLEAVLRQRRVDSPVARRTDALLLSNRGWNASPVADALFLDVETIRDWRRGFVTTGLDVLPLSPYSPRAGHPDFEQQAELKAHPAVHPPRSTRAVRHHVEKSYGTMFPHSGMIKLMARLGFIYKKPKALPLAAKESEQREFIRHCNGFLNSMDDDEAVVPGDAVHPEHQSRPAYLAGICAKTARQLPPRRGASGSIFTAVSIRKPFGFSLSKLGKSTRKPPVNCCRRWRMRTRKNASFMCFSTTPVIIMPGSCSPGRNPRTGG